MAESGRPVPASGRVPARVPVRVKVCGITRPEDARLAARAGASYVGAVLSAGFKRSVDARRAAGFLSRDEDDTGDAVLVAVVVDEGVAGAVALAERAGAGVLQLHGREEPDELLALAAEGPWRLWKALRVSSRGQVLDALDRYGGVAHGLLLEGDHPGRGGGTGASFPWEEVAGLRERFPDGLAFIAAGGLTPLNVAEAIRVLRPDIVDASSGVEGSPGVKDPELVEAFVRVALGESVAVLPEVSG